MFPFWEIAIAPVLEAAMVRRVVEIGALRGETTLRMLDRLGPDCELHVIDPVPDFDPAEHEEKFAGRYIFHRDTSHRVLPDLAPMDAALIDGDHNWFTVYHELKLLSATARDAGEALPVLIMHDVCWPYGRRDLYYAPEQIPEEFRQPYRQAGMRRDRRDLLARGGLNPTMNNAVKEGGERNGVMTALDDFIAEYDRPLRRLVLPMYFGLAIVVEEERLERQPEVAAVLDRLESSSGRAELIELAEDIRLRGMIFQHNVFYQRQAQIDRSAQRYLNVVKAALLDEHYLENEARLGYLVQCIERGTEPDAIRLRDPARGDKDAFRKLRTARRSGASQNDPTPLSYFPFTAMGRSRLDHLEQSLDTIRAESIEGDLAECGTGRGGGAIFLRSYLDAYEQSGPQVWVADSFRASPELSPSADLAAEGLGNLRADLNVVRDGFEKFDLLDERVRFLQGPFTATLPDAPIEKLALLRLGDVAGEAIGVVLEHLYDKVAPGGFIIVDDLDEAGSREAVERFRTSRRIETPVERVDWTTVSWRKSSAEADQPRRATRPPAAATRAPLAPALPDASIDLSVVVVFYNMRREALRTLHSLTRSYQQGVEDLDYEVLVVENGSAPDQRLGEDMVRGFGPEFRYIDLGSEASPSPAEALNRGIRLARGRAFALMIDGAHVLTPGVLRFGMSGLDTYQPAIVATQQWYVGPGQQGDVMQSGYDQPYEDKLFEGIGWPADGYRLFEIGHFIGERDWFDGVWESNCMFVPRRLLEQVGGFDESFSMAGGGYANLDLYERLGSSADVTVASIIGEGSFHQVHGGTTTNQIDPVERRSRVFSYGQHYAEVRGRRFSGPGKPIHYVGGLQTSSARRTRARRMSADAFAVPQSQSGPDGRPDSPTPVPDELKLSFIDAFWRSLAWKRTTWLGRSLQNAPTDLIAYQEILSTVRPDWVIDTGTGSGGRALFLASICELLGHGQVVSIDYKSADVPQHPRITYLQGKAHEASTVAAVREIVGEGAHAMVVLGSRGGRQRMRLEFEALAPFVPVGSYVIMEDTIVNGHPVWAAFGPGPNEAAKRVLALYGDFVADPAMEKFTLTFNPGGFLKRVR